MNHGYVKIVLFLNGIIDILGAFLMIFFPDFIPGYPDLPYQARFAAGGWGIAALTFGIGRIWTSRKPMYHGFMVVLGLIEGVTLSMFCVVRILFSPTSLVQASIPFTIAVVFTIAYGLCFAFQEHAQEELKP
jgi:hypothetical protein